MYPNEYIGVNDGLPGSRASFLLSGLCNFGSFSFLKSFSEGSEFPRNELSISRIKRRGYFFRFSGFVKMKVYKSGRESVHADIFNKINTNVRSIGDNRPLIRFTF